MSHLESIECYCTDLDALAVVADRLGFELVRGARSFKWFGALVADYEGATAAVSRGYDPKTFGQCDHALRLKNATAGSYEIGLVRRIDGQPGWELLFDSWGVHGQLLEKYAGAKLTTLKDQLAAEVTRRQLARQGYRLQQRTLADGTIEITATR